MLASEAGIDVDALERAVADGWIRAVQDRSGLLRLYNYTPAAQYERIWTPETLQARGLILSRDGEVVARPLPKFFNMSEPDAPAPVGNPRVTEKLDGSLAIAYRDAEGKIAVATRGSFQSEQALAAGRHLVAAYPEWEPEEGVTYLFEWIAPEHRIVVDYGAKRDLVLLARLEMATGADLDGEGTWPGEVVRSYDGITELDDVLAMWNRGGEGEGYVLRFDPTGDGEGPKKPSVRLKLKFDEYVALHKIITGTNARALWEQVVARELADLDPISLATSLRVDPATVAEYQELGALSEFVAILPDEMHPWAEGIIGSLRESYEEIVRVHREEVAAVRAAAPEDRKALAELFGKAKARGLNPSLLFLMWDGRENQWRSVIWRSLRPEATDGLGLAQKTG